MIDKSKKRSLKKGAPKWDKALDNDLAKVKKQAEKNGNFFIFVLTSENLGAESKVTGLQVSSQFDAIRATQAFLSSLPPEVLSIALMRNAIED